MTPPPRPTMSAEDVKAVRDFFDSPAGKAMLGEIQKSFDVPPMSCDEPEVFWRDRDGNRIEAEGACADPLDPSRPFPAPQQPSIPKEVARVTSLRRSMLITMITCTLALGSWLVWIVVETLRSHT